MLMKRTYRALLMGNTDVHRPDTGLDSLYDPHNDVARLSAALSDTDWGLHDLANVIRLADATKSKIELAMEDFF